MAPGLIARGSCFCDGSRRLQLNIEKALSAASKAGIEPTSRRCLGLRRRTVRVPFPAPGVNAKLPRRRERAMAQTSSLPDTEGGVCVSTVSVVCGRVRLDRGSVGPAGIEKFDHFGFVPPKSTPCYSQLSNIFSAIIYQFAAPNRRRVSQICVARAHSVHTGPWPIAVEPVPTGWSLACAALPAPSSHTPSAPRVR
jgi:hypothetical protein